MDRKSKKPRRVLAALLTITLGIYYIGYNKVKEDFYSLMNHKVAAILFVTKAALILATIYSVFAVFIELIKKGIHYYANKA